MTLWFRRATIVVPKVHNLVIRCKLYYRDREEDRLPRGPITRMGRGMASAASLTPMPSFVICL